MASLHPGRRQDSAQLTVDLSCVIGMDSNCRRFAIFG